MFTPSLSREAGTYAGSLSSAPAYWRWQERRRDLVLHDAVAADPLEVARAVGAGEIREGALQVDTILVDRIEIARERRAAARRHRFVQPVEESLLTGRHRMDWEVRDRCPSRVHLERLAVEPPHRAGRTEGPDGSVCHP